MVTLNENTIRRMISETIQSLLLEFSIPWGSNGESLEGQPTTELIKDIPQAIWNRIDSGKRDIKDSEIDSIFGDTLIYKIYNQYKSAIEGNGFGRKAVNFFLFLKCMRDGKWGCPLFYTESNGNYLFGIRKMGCFFSVYIAPNGPMGLARLLSDIGRYSNVVFAVTDEGPKDMASMLKRMQCPQYTDKIVPTAKEGVIDCKFRGSMHEKCIFGTTIEAAKTGAKILYSMNIRADKGNTLTDEQRLFLLQNPDVLVEFLMHLKELNATAPHKAQSFISSNPDLASIFGSNNPQIGSLIDLAMIVPFLFSKI